MPWDATILAAWATNSVANTSAATVLTLEIGGGLVTMPVLQFGATDALGTVISSIPTANNVVSAGGSIEVITDGGGTPVMPVVVTLLLGRT